MASEKKGDAERELLPSNSMEGEHRDAADTIVDDTPDVLLVLAKRLQKALDARPSRTNGNRESRAKKH